MVGDTLEDLDEAAVIRCVPGAVGISRRPRPPLPASAAQGAVEQDVGQRVGLAPAPAAAGVVTLCSLRDQAALARVRLEGRESEAGHQKPYPVRSMTRRMVAHYRTGSRPIPKVVGLALLGLERSRRRRQPGKASPVDSSVTRR